jgi:hypothetical protein
MIVLAVACVRPNDLYLSYAGEVVTPKQRTRLERM